MDAAGMVVRRSLRVGGALALVAALALGLAPVSAVHAADDASVYVVQGLPGEKVDISIDGDEVATDVEGAEVVGPFTVSGGEHELAFSADGDELLSQSMKVEAGSSWDTVLHLANEKNEPPMLTVFENDLSAVGKGKARLSVAHTAAVGPADIKVDGDVLFANVANGEQLTLVVPGGSYDVEIVPTGEDGPSVLGPAPLTVQADALNRVYAIGDPGDESMTVAAHVIELGTKGSGKPKRVDTGSSGLAHRLGLTARS